MAAQPQKKTPSEIAKAIDEKVDVYRKGKTIDAMAVQRIWLRSNGAFTF